MAEDLSWDELATKAKQAKVDSSMVAIIEKEMHRCREDIASAMEKGEKVMMAAYPAIDFPRDFLKALNKKLPEPFKAYPASGKEDSHYEITW